LTLWCVPVRPKPKEKINMAAIDPEDLIGQHIRTTNALGKAPGAKVIGYNPHPTYRAVGNRLWPRPTPGGRRAGGAVRAAA
jgi:hypothetical protein